MQHRHLTEDAGWSKAAIDSVLERGNLADWRELFAAARLDAGLAERIIEVAGQNPTQSSALAIYLAKRSCGVASYP